MIRRAAVWVVECDGDGCDREFEVYADEPHWESYEAAAREIDMGFSGWVRREGRTYCHECACAVVGHQTVGTPTQPYCRRCSKDLDRVPPELRVLG